MWSIKMIELTPEEVALRIITERNLINNREREQSVMTKRMQAARDIENIKLESSALSEGLL